MSKFLSLDVDRELLLEFFLYFACFEFALKSTGFARGDEKSVSPDWSSYANFVKDKFDKTANDDLNDASNYLLENPPMKQVLLPVGISWSADVPNDGLSDLEKLLTLVRGVRNNLFHGGKFNIDTHEQPERTKHLLRSCLIVLDACLELSPNVRIAFDSARI